MPTRALTGDHTRLMAAPTGARGGSKPEREQLAKRKQYSDEFRASAVVMLESQGYPDVTGALSAVASHLHVPARTLSRWYRRENNPPPDNLVREKSGDLAALLRQEAVRKKLI